jgi:hypothetical protein
MPDSDHESRLNARALTPPAGGRTGFLHRRPRSQSVVPVVCVACSVFLLLGAGACTKQSGGEKAKPAGAVSDTSAYNSAMALADTTARMSALEAFLKNYPKSSYRAPTYSRLCDLMAARDTTSALRFSREHLKMEKDPASRGRLYYGLYKHAVEHNPSTLGPLVADLSADKETDAEVYNMIGWDLVERNTMLDEAIKLARVGLEKAGRDSLMISYILDTEGWAYYLKREYPGAVAALERARAWSPEPNEETDAHLASAYDAAGEKGKARDLYRDLLFTQEDSDMRGRMEALTKELGGALQKVNAEIDQHRREASYPAKDFTLKNYDGGPIRLADFAGKVVLLNFWHPT